MNTNPKEINRSHGSPHRHGSRCSARCRTGAEGTPSSGVTSRLQLHYPVVIITWVQYLGPPGPFSFPDSRDLLEVLGDFLGRERGGGSLGDPPGP